MEEKRAFDLTNYLKDQIKYLGFGEDKEVHKKLEEGIKGSNEKFQINLTSDRTTFSKEAEFALNFKKTDKGVFLNSYDLSLLSKKGEALKQNFIVSSNFSITAKEAINLLEGRAVKTDIVSKQTKEKEPVFIKLKLNEPKNEYGNYQMQFFGKNYGINVGEIVNKIDFKFDRDRGREFLIKGLEKGNVMPVVFTHEGKEIQGKAVLNPQYKMINLYDEKFNRLNIANPRELDEIKQIEKNNVREQSLKRSMH